MKKSLFCVTVLKIKLFLQNKFNLKKHEKLSTFYFKYGDNFSTN